MTGDISEDESRVCRCTMGLFPGDKLFLRNDDALGEVSRDYIVTCPAVFFSRGGQLSLSYMTFRSLCMDKQRVEVNKKVIRLR